MKNKNIVVYIGGFDLPDKNAAAQRVLTNSKLFVDLGYEVYLFGLSKSKSVFTYSRSIKCENLHRPESLTKWCRYLLTTKTIKNKIFKIKPSLIIAYNYPAIALISLRKLCKSMNIKLIADCTEWYQAEGNILYKCIKSIDTALRMRYAHVKIDGVIAISSFLNNYYISRNCKTILLPPLVDLKEKKWHIRDNDRDSSKKKDEIQLLYAGTPGKGNKDRLDMIIMAMSKMSLTKPISFNIIGIDENTFRKNFRYKYEIPKFVNFHGRQSHCFVLNLLSKSDFQIFIRQNNLINTAGFPTKFVEAISCGVLVLTNLSSDIKEYLVDGINGFILNTASIESLKKSLEDVVNMPKSSIDKMKGNLKCDVFDYRKYTTQMLEFISSIQKQ